MADNSFMLRILGFGVGRRMRKSSVGARRPNLEKVAVTFVTA